MRKTVIVQIKVKDPKMLNRELDELEKSLDKIRDIRKRNPDVEFNIELS